MLCGFLPYNNTVRISCVYVSGWVGAKLLQSYLTLCDAMDCSPPGYTVHGIFQTRMLEMGCHFLPQGIFPIQGSNSCFFHLLHCHAGSLPLVPPGKSKDFLLLLVATLAYFWHAAAAKSLQSCPTLCDPIHGSPPGSPVPGILQTRTLEWVAISFSNAWKWKVKGKSVSLSNS